MPDVVSAGYLSQCVAVVHLGIVDLHSFTMVTNCLVKSKYTTKRPIREHRAPQRTQETPHQLQWSIFVAFKVRNKLRNPFGLR